MEEIETWLYEEEIARWLGDDKMRQQSSYHYGLQDLRADQACEHLLAKDEFKRWCCASGSDPALAILGDLGSGKTVAMSFIFDELCQRREHQVPRPLICSYYYQNEETGHATYIYPVLILQLLQQIFQQFPGLGKSLFEWYKQNSASGEPQPATGVHKLDEFLHKIVGSLDRPLFMVIDGLDECDEVSRDMVINSLRSLSQSASGFKILLSSRPQERVFKQLHGLAKIHILADPERDRIIAEKTVIKRLLYLPKETQTLIIERLSGLAQGSALWTKMVVDLLAAHRIRALQPMRTFLNNIPQPEKLSKSYSDLFVRYTSGIPENQDIAATALEILAVARRRMSILELSWAVAMGTEQNVTTVVALAQLVDHRRVISLIQPFIARVGFDDLKKRQLVLIHPSVKDFIVQEWASNRPASHSVPTSHTRADKYPSLPTTARLEKGLLDICLRYILLEEIGHTALFTEEQVAIEEQPQALDLFDDYEDAATYDPHCTWETWEEDMIRYDPADRGFGEFFAYASCHWLDHYGAITAEPLPDLISIENVCQANSTRLHNWTSQNSRPDCVLKARFVFDGSLYDPLSITSLYGSKAMLAKMLENSTFDDKGTFLADVAMGAADQTLQWGDLTRLEMLFQASRLGYRLQSLDFFRLLMEAFCFCDTDYGQDWDAALDLINDIPDVVVKEGWGNELLCMAARMGCLPIIQRMMKLAQHHAELKTELLRGPDR